MFSKILVTGSRGPLGQGLQAIKNTFPGSEFVFSNSQLCDLTDAPAVMAHVGEHKPDAILHLAALSGGIGYSAKFPATLLRANVLMALNVLESARAHGVTKVVLTLSTGIYPENVFYPIKEEYLHDGPPHESAYSYSFAKRLMEPCVRAYRTECGMNVIGLSPNGILGEGCRFDESATMVPALIKRFYESRHGTSKLVVWGDGSPLREYTYAKDLAKAFMWCLHHYHEPGILHVGTTEEVSVKDIAFMIADELGIDRGRLFFDTSKPGGIYRKPTDNAKFLKLSGFEYTPFRIGLANTIAWYRGLASATARDQVSSRP
ncbi:MAG: NAD-dependent epimerase/dehydratase family protein [Deltaproteobacteria bacterium]|nr:NAD-dependent epimerase/dehydratase family protein [Deltaproteobacteria bacterium]